ncbi:hypothetical protein CCHR01_13901 [Colletotrichum chrysophilum]|uniref:Uncharacterized protein n=1 Tax=Colletotrichum chrysophilum TaxID=1836956 RepID=A0AAD9ADF9_9PEZI|nr:hypothetical protein CCHR01_13901 [Colletotrichum chrysophilum]
MQIAVRFPAGRLRQMIMASSKPCSRPQRDPRIPPKPPQAQREFPRAWPRGRAGAWRGVRRTSTRPPVVSSEKPQPRVRPSPGSISSSAQRNAVVRIVRIHTSRYTCSDRSP